MADLPLGEPGQGPPAYPSSSLLSFPPAASIPWPRSCVLASAKGYMRLRETKFGLGLEWTLAILGCNDCTSVPIRITRSYAATKSIQYWILIESKKRLNRSFHIISYVSFGTVWSYPSIKRAFQVISVHGHFEGFLTIIFYVFHSLNGMSFDWIDLYLQLIFCRPKTSPRLTSILGSTSTQTQHKTDQTFDFTPPAKFGWSLDSWSLVSNEHRAAN